MFALGLLVATNSTEELLSVDSKGIDFQEFDFVHTCPGAKMATELSMSQNGYEG